MCVCVILQCTAEIGGDEGGAYGDEGERVGGRQGHFGLPSLQETFLLESKKGMFLGAGKL